MPLMLPSWKTVLVVLFGSAAAVIVLCGLLGPRLARFNPDLIETTYTGATEVREGKRKGWIPEFVPDSAAAVLVIDDLDSNEHCGAFSFTEAQGEVIRSRLPRRLESEVRLPACRLWGMAGWPSWFGPRLDHEQGSARGFELFRDEDVVLAIDWSGRRAFYASVRR